MSKIKLLDCTLRDGGYITDWKFDNSTIRGIISSLRDSNIDYIEVGYLNNKGNKENSTQFINIDSIINYLPSDHSNVMILAMADVSQFSSDNITMYSGKSIDAIRVVFYKHQIEKAFTLGTAIKSAGYKLFMQPMVTIDYSLDEYDTLVKKLSKIEPYGVSIVDSFGYMVKADFRAYFSILDKNLPFNTQIGFHSHNNMNLAFVTAQDVFEYETDRTLVIDSSLYGMGRGAGNLQTELIANYYNSFLEYKYDLSRIIALVGKYILPIYAKRQWGYSPHLFITGLYHCHPNYACYLLEEYPETDVEEFEYFIQNIPDEMKTKCKKPYVLELWNEIEKV